jgi:hypothetical protein
VNVMYRETYFGGELMKTSTRAVEVLIICVLFTSVLSGKEPHFYQKGRIAQMDAVSCGYDENSGKSVLGEVIGTDNAHKKTKEMLCQEYILRSDHVIYRIRPRDEKHPVLLPVGEDAEFRLQKDKLYLRVKELDDKERDYSVVSMTPVENTAVQGR